MIETSIVASFFFLVQNCRLIVEFTVCRQSLNLLFLQFANFDSRISSLWISTGYLGLKFGFLLLHIGNSTTFVVIEECSLLSFRWSATY